MIGTGYVGAVTSACLAWLGHDVCGLDVDPKRAGQLNLGQIPFYEPGLVDLLTETLPTDPASGSPTSSRRSPAPT